MIQPTPAALVRAQRAIESFSVGRARVVFGLREVRRGRYRSHLYLTNVAGGRIRQLTHGDVRDESPAVAPDGRQVAFARAPVGDDPPDSQIWVLPLDGGEGWQLTRLPHGAGTPRWSPDRRRLAFLGQAGPHRFGVGREVKDRALTARRMTRLDFRDDEAGFLSRRSHLWVAAARPGARARQLTTGDFDVLHPAWSPDGRWLAYAADDGPDANIAPRTRLFRVAPAGGTPQLLAELPGDADWPAVSPDGRLVAFIGTEVADPPDEVHARLWVAPVDGATPPRCLTASLDRPVGEHAWADLVMAEEDPGPEWLDDTTLAVIVAVDGRNLPFRVTLDGEVTPLADPGRLVGAGLAADDGQLVMTAGNDGRAADIWRVGPPKEVRPLTRVGSAWQDRFPPVRWEELWIDGPAGRIQTWVVSPARARARPLPAVIVFHGGPTGAFAPGGTLDSLMLVGHGYRVILPNLRGSASFGSSWIAGLGGRWGEADAEDALAVTDEVVARGLVDPDRIGIMGLSYGGYLVHWLIGITDRFAAGVSENGVTNQVSAWANSFFGVHYNRRARLGEPLAENGMRQLWNISPLRNVASIHTPLLILQAEEDRVCPPADNEQMFTALKVLGRRVEYILYPEEHHEMKNYGRPDRRIDRMERILAWFERHVRGRSGGR